MVDIDVSGAAWFCRTEGRCLADVLLPVHLSNKNIDEEDDLSQSDREKVDPVLLEQVEEGAPCVVTLSCSSSAAISRLLVISEARTVELYDQLGEYCGTVRGTEDKSVQSDSGDRGPFYRMQLVLDRHSSACDLKLLSLAGRTSVLVCRVIVGLQELQPGPARGPGIDLEQVQSLVEEMGTSLSPGAQHLMDMVQFQQRNQTSSLGGFLPLLMGGGALSALTGGVGVSAAAFRNLLQPADATPLDVTAAQSGGMSEGSSSPDLSLSDLSSNNTSSSDNVGPMGHAQLEEMMSHFLKGRGHEQALSPDLLPMLQSVCGQVTQLRLADAEEAAERKKTRNGLWELDSVMEQRLEDMERRLKEHVDRRLDALEQKLEQVLLGVFNHADVGRSAAGVGTERTVSRGHQDRPPVSEGANRLINLSLLTETHLNES